MIFSLALGLSAYRSFLLIDPMQITEIFHVIHKPFSIAYLQLQVLLQLTFFKGDQVLTFDLVLVEDLAIGLHLDGVQEVQHLFHAPFLQVFGDEGKLG